MASATTNSTQEAMAAFGLKNAMPIESKKTPGMTRLLNKWKFANLGSSSSLVRIGPLKTYHHTS